jgi:hypothetical protein
MFKKWGKDNRRTQDSGRIFRKGYVLIFCIAANAVTAFLLKDENG